MRHATKDRFNGWRLAVLRATYKRAPLLSGYPARRSLPPWGCPCRECEWVWLHMKRTPGVYAWPGRPETHYPIRL